MTNIFKSLKKNQLNRAIDRQGASKCMHRRDIPAVKIWYNSVYAFNKNSTRFLPAVHEHLFNILKAYFNMTNANMEKKSKLRKYRIIRRLSGRKIWVSTPEIKHLNDRMNITVYVYNRIFIHYKKKLPLIGLKWLPKKLILKKRKWLKLRTKFIKKAIKLKYKKIEIINRKKNIIKKKRKIMNKKIKKLFKVKSYKSIMLIKKAIVKTKKILTLGLAEKRLNKVLYTKRKNTILAIQRKLKIKKVLFLISMLKKKIMLFNNSKLSKNIMLKQILILISIYMKLKILEIKPINIKNKFNILKKTIESHNKDNKSSSKNKKKELMKETYIKVIKRLKQDKLNIMNNYKLSLLEYTNKGNYPLYKMMALKAERYNYLIKTFKMELIYLKFIQNKLFHEFKFNELYLIPLIGMLEEVYRKKIEFNIVSLKYNYLSSSILSQIVVTKIKTSRNRGKAFRPVVQALVKVKPPILSSSKIAPMDKKHIGMQNEIFNEHDNNLEKFIQSNKISKSWSTKNIENIAMANIENKNIAGVFIKVSGRLTKRYKAQRAISTLKYKGTLKNIYSSYKGYSSSTLRGYENINVEKTMIHSKVKIGAFGLKGWVSSY